MYKLSWNDFDKDEYVLDEAFLLQELDEKANKTELEDIERHMPEIMQALINGKGLHVFGEKRMLDILEVVQPKNLEELARCYALYDSPDLWEKVAKELLINGEVALADLIVFKEEIYEYLIKVGIGSDDAFAIMDYASEHIGLPEEMKTDISSRNISEWTIKLFENVFYFSRRRTALACANVAIQLINYRLYYPELFYETYCKHYVGHNMAEMLKEVSLFLSQEELDVIGAKEYKIPYRVDEDSASKNIDMKKAVEILGILEIETDFDAVRINLEDEEVIAIFQNPYGQFQKCTTRGIVGFGDDEIMDVLQKFKPKNLSELAKVLVLALNVDLLNCVEKTDAKKKIVNLNELIVYQEEIYERLLEMGYRSQEAYHLMQRIRRGKKLTVEVKEKLLSYGATDWLVESLDNTKYFAKRESQNEVAQLAFRLAYYKLHYPKEFCCAYWKAAINDDFRRLEGERNR